MSARNKPLITANKVTVVRLVPMPLVTWLFYGDLAAWWTAFALGSLIAMTDFVDGFLARKHGPTVLGALLDPIADKVFVALTFLPLMHLGILPAWPVAILFLREFLVTGLRSAYEQRKLSFKTSYFAKVKTWAQMQGLFMIMVAVATPRDLMIKMLIAASIVPLVPVAGMWLVKRSLYRGALIMSGLMASTIPMFAIPSTTQTSVHIVVYVITAITVLSGLDYVVGGVPRLLRAGDIGRADLVRIISALAIPITAVAVLARTGVSPAAVFALLSLELAVGGLDNLLSHHRASAGALAWSLRSLGAAALLGACLVVDDVAAINALALAAMVVSLIGVVREFYRGRDYFLDEKKRDEAAAPAPSSALSSKAHAA